MSIEQKDRTIAHKSISDTLARHGYEIDFDAILGKGSFGAVFGISNQSGETLVAKVCSPFLNTITGAQTPSIGTYERQYSREEQAFEKIGKHNNIVKLIDNFTTSQNVKLSGRKQTVQSFYFIMEKVIGMNLREYVNTNGVFTESAFKQVACGLVSAVAHLHRCGIFHRDVKPENILLQEGESGLNAKLIDFGIATNLETGDDLCGSLTTMSPEAFRNLFFDIYYDNMNYLCKYNHKVADCYQLGACIFYALHGEFPIWNRDNAHVRVKLMQQMFLTDNLPEHNAAICYSRVSKHFRPVSSSLSDECKNVLKVFLEANPEKRKKSVFCHEMARWIPEIDFNEKREKHLSSMYRWRSFANEDSLDECSSDQGCSAWKCI